MGTVWDVCEERGGTDRACSDDGFFVLAAACKDDDLVAACKDDGFVAACKDDDLALANDDDCCCNELGRFVSG